MYMRSGRRRRISRVGSEPVCCGEEDEVLCTENESRLVQWTGSLARLGHLLDVQKVAGSSPVRPTNDNYSWMIHSCSMN